MKFSQFKQSLSDRKKQGTALSASPESWVRLSSIAPGVSLPLVIEPATAGLDPAAWAGGSREFLENLLGKHGALLFRNFPIRGAEDFENFARALSGPLMDYRENTSPRSQVRGNVYTSTDYPPDQAIVLHNEHSYSHVFPMKLFLYCDLPPESGGETPLADSRRILARIPPAIRDRFQKRKWRYEQNFTSGLGLTWQDTFQTTDKAAVEAHCRRAQIDFQWISDHHLRTSYLRRAEATHPKTGEETWFNHILFWHITSLAAPFRDVIQAELPESDYPNQTRYGDGSAIEDSTIAAIRDAYERETVSFPWQQGDLLVVDNMLAAHGRQPFVPPRKILFAMNEPFHRSDLFSGETHA